MKVKVDKSKRLYLNALIMLKAAAVGTWFYAVNRTLHRIFPEARWMDILVMVLFSLTVLLYEDGMLSELHNLKSSTVAAAITNVPDNSNFR